MEDSRSPGSWLVLALVIEQPSHGYELSQRYQRRFGSFLPMSVPRVYGALDLLKGAKMIEPVALKPGQSTSRQHLMRRSYRATRAGVQAYQRWVAERMRDDPQRPQLLGRIASAGVLGVDDVIDVIDQYQRECMEELRALPANGERLEDSDASLEDLMDSLIIDQQRRELRARNDWAVHARQMVEGRRTQLEAHEQSGSGDPRKRAKGAS